jgi:hypothetical protein
MTTKNTPSQHFGFSPDPVIARQLGFISISLGGSRTYKYPPQEVPTTYDWDFVGLVERKCDILGLLLHRREELWDMLGIVEPEQFPWKVSFPACHMFGQKANARVTFLLDSRECNEGQE